MLMLMLWHHTLSGACPFHRKPGTSGAMGTSKVAIDGFVGVNRHTDTWRWNTNRLSNDPY